MPGPMLSLHPVTPELKRAAMAGSVTRMVEGAAGDVIARWERSRTLGADPDGSALIESAIVDSNFLREARDRTEELQRGAHGVLDGFASACAASDFLGVLADSKGVVVRTFGGGAFAPEARRLRLIDGTAWDESLRGTNAIGTGLAEKRPVAVHGSAHFSRVNEGMVCFAAPIFDPRGEVVGILDATSYAERASVFDPGVVITVARALEEVLRARAYAGPNGGIALVERLMERATAAALLVEAPVGALGVYGRVVRANRTARAITGGAAAALPPWERLLEIAGDPHAAGRRITIRSTDYDVVAVPLQGASDDVIALLVMLHELMPRLRAVPAPSAPAAFTRILGSDRELAVARERCERLARSQLPVLLLAETGTGKELFARAIHETSARASGPYVTVNCGAIQRELLLTELFGHGPGAFTGAARAGRDGLVAAADGGTLFLDEIADLSPDAQVALLRVLEDGSYHRVGETLERHADIRVVAATSRDLPERVANGAFRDDLYFRVGGACVELPPLRKRTDLDELVDVLWSRVKLPDGGPPASLSAEAVAALRAYAWPGNVRELESALEYAAVMSDGESATGVEHLPPSVARAPESAADARGGAGAEHADADEHSLDAARRAALREALERSGGNVSAAARELGVARSTVYRLARRLGL